MGVWRIISRGDTRGFFQNFSRGSQKWWHSLFPTQNYKNNLFLLRISPSRGGLAPTAPPSEAHDCNILLYSFIFIM